MEKVLGESGVVELWKGIKERISIGNGLYGFHVNEEGHLILGYAGNDAPPFSVEEGHLTVDIPPKLDLGSISGPAGPDGNPIGTIISFMGSTPPKDYLVCDGSSYSLSQYSDLANFFEKQFGSKYYFGGSGDSFNLPDLRDLFLRGFHGSNDNQLSGNIGKKQEATSIPGLWVGIGSDKTAYIGVPNDAVRTNDGYEYVSTNPDTTVRAKYNSWVGGVSNVPPDNPDKTNISYTSRPVNMAVLYCIKAIESKSFEHVYSDEEVVIGTWFGKTLYRKVFQGRIPLAGRITSIGRLENGCDIKNFYGHIIDQIDQAYIPLNYYNGGTVLVATYASINDGFANEITCVSHFDNINNETVFVTVEYTKN